MPGCTAPSAGSSPQFDALAQTALHAAFCDDSTRARLAKRLESA